MASSTLYSFAFGPLHKSWVIIRFAVGSGFSFWIICDSSESSYSDIPARPSHVTSDHPRRLWTAAGEHFARCDEYVCSDASRPTSWGPCELDTGVTTWPTYMYLYVPHNRHINRWIITAACGCCYSSDDRLVGRQYSGSQDKSNSELESSPSLPWNPQCRVLTSGSTLTTFNFAIQRLLRTSAYSADSIVDPCFYSTLI